MVASNETSILEYLGILVELQHVLKICGSPIRNEFLSLLSPDPRQILLRRARAYELLGQRDASLEDLRAVRVPQALRAMFFFFLSHRKVDLVKRSQTVFLFKAPMMGI